MAGLDDEEEEEPTPADAPLDEYVCVLGSELEDEALKTEPALLAVAETIESADVGRVKGRGLMRPIGVRLDPAD